VNTDKQAFGSNLPNPCKFRECRITLNRPDAKLLFELDAQKAPFREETISCGMRFLSIRE
jgi:hypothetical protein